MKIHYRALLFILIAILTSATLINKASASDNDVNGNTQLISAVNSGNTDLVKQLISKGADVNAQNAKGYNALLTAVESNCQRGSNNADIINLLINNRADIYAKNPEGETVLDIALACKQRDVINDLLKAGVNPWTPQAGKAGVFFVDHGLKVDVNIMVGKKSKYLGKDGGVVFFDVDPGKYNISAQSPSAFYYSAANLASPLKVIAGEVYYFQVTEKEGERLDYLTSLVKDRTNYPIGIVPIQEAQAKKEIKGLLKLKEVGEEKKSVASASAETAKPDLPKPTNSAIKEKSPEVSAEPAKPDLPQPTNSAVKKKTPEVSVEAAKPNPPKAATSAAKEKNPEFFGYAQQLRELKKLREEGLLTNKEYEKKRKAIVDKM